MKDFDLDLVIHQREPSENAMHVAARCWCDPETETIEMDHKLAMAFAKRIDVLMSMIPKTTRLQIVEAEIGGLMAQIGDRLEEWKLLR